MAKKPKNPEKTKAKANDDGGSDVFKSLFGDVPQQDTSGGSIFSDTNPFRRKPIDRLELESIGNPKDGDSVKEKLVEEKKRKRNKEKKQGDVASGSASEAPETPLEAKKSKRDAERSGDVDVGTKLEDGRKKLNSELQLKESLEDDKGKEESDLIVEREGDGKGKEDKMKKKKRKREEVEEKYEARRYGALVAKDEGGGEEKLGAKTVGEKRKKMDNPEDTLVSKEGFDDEDKLLRTVFVGNLPVKVKKKVLLKEFSQFGEVESVRIRSVPLTDSKVPRKGAILQKKINDSADSVHAYVVFKSEQSAQASLAHNMAVVGGNHIRVDRACPPRKKLKGDDSPLYDNKRTVFVGNLPFDVKDEELYQLFCGISNLESGVEAVRVIRDPNTSVGKGFAYVLFKTRGAANLVVNKRNLKIRDRDLRLYHSKATPSKRQNEPVDQKYRSPAKKLAMGSRTPDSDNNRFKPKAAISYQGLRASKSGVQKKVHSKVSEPLRQRPRNHLEKPKERVNKRPSVAARKANALTGAGGGSSSKQGGKKRKLESRTPESARKKMKMRKFR